MVVGSIVKPTAETDFVLASGGCWYHDAVVISLEPFILTSRESDMRWSCIKLEDFEETGEICDAEKLNHCMRRL